MFRHIPSTLAYTASSRLAGITTLTSLYGGRDDVDGGMGDGAARKYISEATAA